MPFGDVVRRLSEAPSPSRDVRAETGAPAQYTAKLTLAPLPYELFQDPERPTVCVGADAHHTPARVAAVIEARCLKLGLTVQRNRPFEGSYVPLPFYRQDSRVSSVMIEVRRDLYCDERTGRRGRGFTAACRSVRSIVRAALAAWQEAP